MVEADKVKLVCSDGESVELSVDLANFSVHLKGLIDENGTEWFEDDDGYWWFREEGQEEWQPYEEDDED